MFQELNKNIFAISDDMNSSQHIIKNWSIKFISSRNKINRENPSQAEAKSDGI